MKLFFLFFMISTSAYSFHLNPATGRGFNKNTINIHIASTSCTGAGFSTQKFKDMIEDAVEDYWNSVPTSALKLNVKSIGSIDITGDTFESALAKVSSNTILAGCNTTGDDEFSGGGSPSSILGAARMSCSGSKCKAVLILNAHADSQLPNKGRGEVEAVIAHEIGHAIGIGHSEFPESLMYYSASGKFQRWLGMDDVDAVTYLYPYKSDDPLGLSGSCATIDIDPQGPNSNFILTLLFSLLMSLYILGSKKINHKLRNP